jgi:endonuclease/exonuclease/phosphatase family metal-dependent hydrolase
LEEIDMLAANSAVAARVACVLACVGIAASGASAQWDPQNGQYRKTDSRDLRVMTWNIRDRICSTGNKLDGINGWTAESRIVAAMRPDVLIMQETGDNSANGTGTSIDSVAALTTTLGLFVRGGFDPVNNVQVTAYVQKWAPGYDLPYVYVSPSSDNFNRNVLLSRYPFKDLNGDTVTAIPDATVGFDLYAPGGGLGIRGFLFAEIDLPDGLYRGDVVVGTGHLKSGSASGDLSQRLNASKNIAYYIDYLFNGAGGGTPDPRSKIFDFPAATTVLGPYTPVIWGGDMNEDEATNGRVGPVEWLVQAAAAGGTDGTDRDRSDSSYDDSRDIFNSAQRRTFGSSAKLDYIMWQDSIATLRRSFIFNSGSIPAGKYPPEIIGYAPPNGEGIVTGTSSDHLPVIADFILPAIPAPGAFVLSSPTDGSVAVPLTTTLTWNASADATSYTVKIASDAGLTSVISTVPGLTTTSYAIPEGVLANCQTYFWGVTAVNGSGSVASTPTSFTFDSKRPTDLNDDGVVDFGDFLFFFNCYDVEGTCADLDGNEGVDFGDFLFFFNGYDVEC